MKNKVIVVILFIVSIFIISLGCFYQFDKNENSSNNKESNNTNDNNSTKKTICTYEGVSSGVKYTDTYTFLYVNDMLKSYSLVLKYEYSKESEEGALRYKGDSIKEQVASSLNVDGIDITHTDENYVITNSYMYDLEKYDFSDSSVSSSILPRHNLNDSVSEIVKEIKSWEYSCVETAVD